MATPPASFADLAAKHRAAVKAEEERLEKKAAEKRRQRMEYVVRFHDDLLRVVGAAVAAAKSSDVFTIMVDFEAGPTGMTLFADGEHCAVPFDSDIGVSSGDVLEYILQQMGYDSYECRCAKGEEFDEEWAFCLLSHHD